jgi:hypothetical protein
MAFLPSTRSIGGTYRTVIGLLGVVIVLTGLRRYVLERLIGHDLARVQSRINISLEPAAGLRSSSVSRVGER